VARFEIPPAYTTVPCTSAVRDAVGATVTVLRLMVLGSIGSLKSTCTGRFTPQSVALQVALLAVGGVLLMAAAVVKLHE
jgi:tetrahydromethanopterin S-methyltransferase subunit C